MSNPMFMKMGVQAFGAATDFAIGNIQADMEEATQAYGNSMRLLSSAQQQNTVTLAEAQLKDKSKRLSASLQTASLKDKGAARVSAAAAGVAGGSVKQALLGLKRSALGAQDARMRNLNSNLFAQDQQRRNIQLAAVLGQDTSVIARPSAASAMLGLGAALIDTYDANQPEGSRSFDSDTSISDFFKGE